MATEPLHRLSPEEYLALDRGSEEKYEYVDGEVFDMSGASRRHNLIALNAGTELNLQLRDRPCEVYAHEMRVAVSLQGPYFYPDLVALCGEPELLDGERDTLVNPAVVIEILSPSTEAYDRGLKFARYREIGSLREVLFVSQSEARVERFARQPDGTWRLSDHAGLDAVVDLPDIGCRLELARVYDKVELPPDPSAAMVTR